MVWVKGQSGNPSGRSKLPPEIAEVTSAAKLHTADALATLAEVMRDKEAHPTARVAAANAILDRGWGKPHQTTEDTTKQPRKPLEEVDRRLAELAARNQDLQRGKSNGSAKGANGSTH